jgi:hypothetical protein
MIDSAMRAVIEQEERVAAINARIKALADSISRATTEMESLQPKVEIEISRLAGMKSIVDILNSNVGGIEPIGHNEQSAEATTDDGVLVKPSRRRMRLGPKKRVIFQLVANGIRSLSAISSAVQGTGIDARFLRDCLRTAVIEHELSVNAEDYALTVLGSELLEKSPISRDWELYASLFNSKEVIASLNKNEAPNANASEPQ